MIPVSHGIYSIAATCRVLYFLVLFRTSLYIIHFTHESNLTRNLVDFMDFMTPLSHDIYSITATCRVLYFVVVFCIRFYITHEFSLTRNLVDFMDFMDSMDLLSHGFH